MNKIRFYIIISFVEDSVLIDFFSLVNQYIGKYDYFTQNIRNNYGGYENQIRGRYPNIRVFSFKKLYSYKKLFSLLKKTELIQKKLFLKGFSNYNIICGCMHEDQILSLHRKFEQVSIKINKDMSAQIQMLFINGKPVQMQNSFNEYGIADVKSFFIDLYRIYHDQMGSG